MAGPTSASFISQRLHYQLKSVCHLECSSPFQAAKTKPPMDKQKNSTRDTEKKTGTTRIAPVMPLVLILSLYQKV